jgi:uncharacterized protein
MGKVRAVLVAALVTSCGNAPSTTPKPEAPLEVKTYGPLGMKADSKAPNQAVILGTDDKNGSTILPLPVVTGRIGVDAMFVKMAAKPEDIIGGMSPVKIATAPNSDGSVQVGIFEEFAGGTGPQWRAGVWVSAFVATSTLNKDLTDFTFSATSGGFIDGASASGLMAAGFLATMTGAPIQNDVTMTGIINPDGTIGPVGGVPEKFIASIDKGKKKLGYPIGLKMARSAKTGELVDLEQLAKSKGAEAIEIADVHAAYKLLTNKALPEPLPVAEADMMLDAGTKSALDVKYKQWQTRLATEWGAILQLESAGRLPPILAYLRDYSKEYGEVAESLHKKGLYAAAYARMLAAWAYASSANQIYDVMSRVEAGKIEDALASLDKLDNLDEETRKAFDRIGSLKPPTMGGHLQMMAAFRSALRAWSFRVFAGGSLAATKAYIKSLAGTPPAQLQSEAAADKLAAMVAPTILYVKKTIAETTLAQEQLEFEAATDINYMCSLPNVKRLSTSFSSAGGAGLNYFDTLLVQPFAEAAKISVDDAQQRIALAEPDYLVALMASRLANQDGVIKEMRDKWGEQSLAWGLLTLAGSQLAYFHSAELIAKYYSLEIKKNEQGEIIGVEHEKAFANMLASAERNARSNARAAKIATGNIPVQAKLAYELATVEKDGSVSEKLDALGQYWASSAFSQTAVMLARN